MNFKRVEYRGSDSRHRLEYLQSLCKNINQVDHDSKKLVDGVLIIGGIDSNYSSDSHAILKYLFLGYSGQELQGEQVISQHYEHLEDVVLLVCKNTIHIFYSSESDAAIQILPIISQWQNVIEYTINDTMEQDEQEQKKILSFQAMMDFLLSEQIISKDKIRIAIPYGIDANGNNIADIMMPEKWPLIQAFGLDSINTSLRHILRSKPTGFFTQNFDVVNISQEIQQHMKEVDAFHAKRIAHEVPSLLSYHFNQFLFKLDHPETPKARASKSEIEICEDLMSFYDFGTMRFEALGLKSILNDFDRGCKVLYGTRTAIKDYRSSSTFFLANSGISSKYPATHFMVQMEDPSTGICLQRTYFLAVGKLTHKIIDPDAVIQSDNETTMNEDSEYEAIAKDISLLIELYALLLTGFNCAKNKFVQIALDSQFESIDEWIAKAQQYAIRKMREVAKTTSDIFEKSKLPHDFLEQNLNFHTKFIDSCGHFININSCSEWKLVKLSLKLENVPSQNNIVESLGSLIVADTVLFRSSTIRKANSFLQEFESEAELPLITLTEKIPNFRVWCSHGKEISYQEDFVKKLRSPFLRESPTVNLRSLIPSVDLDPQELNMKAPQLSDTAAILTQGIKAQIWLDNSTLPLLTGYIQFYQYGFSFMPHHSNPFFISLANHVHEISFVQSPHDELTLLQFCLRDSLQPFDNPVTTAMPFFYECRYFYLPLLPGTQYKDELLHALGSWKKSTMGLTVRIQQLQEIFIHQTSNSNDFSEFPGGKVHSTSNLSTTLLRMCHDAVSRKRRQSSSLGSTTIEGTEGIQIPHNIFDSEFIPKEFNTVSQSLRGTKSNFIPVTIVIGIPGSNVEQLVEHICDISSGSYDWRHVKIDSRRIPSNTFPAAEVMTIEVHELFVSSHLEKQLELINQQMCRQFTSQKYDSSSLPSRIMISVIGYTSSIAIARSAQSIFEIGASGPCKMKIDAIICSVSATNIYRPNESSSHSALPKLFDQMLAGFTTHIIVTHSNNTSQSELGRLRYRIDKVNPYAETIVLPSDIFETSAAQQLLVSDRYGSIYYKNYRAGRYHEWVEREIPVNLKKLIESGSVPPKEYNMMFPQSVRFRLAPGMTKNKFAAHVVGNLTPFAQVSKTIESLLSGIRIAQKLAAEKTIGEVKNMKLPTQANINSAVFSIWCIEGHVNFASEPTRLYEYKATGAYAQLRLANENFDLHSDENKLELQITGLHVKMNIMQLRDILLCSYGSMDEPIQPLNIDVDTITQAEKLSIQAKHAMDPLPNGYLYDGVQYFDYFGGRYTFHPNIDQYIAEEISSKKKNAKERSTRFEKSMKLQETLVVQITT